MKPLKDILPKVLNNLETPPIRDLSEVETPYKDVPIITVLNNNPAPGHCPKCGFPPDVPGYLKSEIGAIDRTTSNQLIPCPDCHFKKRGRQKDKAGQLQGDLVFKKISNFEPLTESDKAALAAAKAFIDKPYGWLTFHGEYGSGKTHLGAAIANALGPEKSRYFNVPDLASKLRDSLSDSVERFIEGINLIPILILDELEDGHFAGGWSREQLQRIIDYRYRDVKERQLVICTNWSPEQYDNELRFVGSRMRDERFVCVELSEDNRPIAKKLSGGEI